MNHHRGITPLMGIVTALAFCLSFAPSSAAQGFGVMSNRPPEAVKPDDLFTSFDGRFSINLPQRIALYQPVSADTPAERVTGQSFSWTTAQGRFAVSYLDRPEEIEANSKLVFDRLRDQLAAKAGESKGRLTGERESSLGVLPGRELRFELPDGLLVVRFVADERRLYQATAALTKSQLAEEARATKIPLTLRLLDAAGVEAAKRKMVADATPPALPQSPRAARPKSDLEDDRIKGKVKTIFTESEDLSGKRTVQRRKPDSMEQYDERGDLVRRQSWDYRSNVRDIQSYGYIDGARVSNYGSIRYEYDPPLGLAPPAPAGQPTTKPDPRYDTRYGYKYDDRGVLIEEAFYSSTGRLRIRYVYNYKADQLERLAYSTDGSLNQKSISMLDALGNVVARDDYDIKTDTVRSRSKYAYEFDRQGNWVKRTSFDQDTKSGATEYKPSYVSYRTITYY